MLRNKPRLLVVTTRSSISVEPLLRSLQRAGFALALVHGQAAGPTLGDPSIALFPTRPAQFGRVVERVLQDWAPERVIPADEPSFLHVRAIYREHGRGDRLGSAVARTIARSFGDPAAHDQVVSLAALRLFAREHGLPVPNAVAVSDEAMLHVLLESVPLPVMLKDDGDWGGARAETVRSVAAGIAAYHRLIGARHVATWRKEPRRRSVFLQQHIDGVAAKRAVACRDGTVLTGVSVEPLNGPEPALVAKVLVHPAMESIAAFVVKTLNLSGIVGFDFVLEHGSRRASLIAVKPYATPVSHLMIAGDSGFPAALHAAFATDRDAPRAGDGVVTPFPRLAPRLLAAATRHPAYASGMRWR
ncbi:MAG TPA: hypothetical protein VH020_17000 [Stellaceae bacterium]|jgi:hypothetical protein|nr:hypothetical protein [Stellaceae bacterium]